VHSSHRKLPYGSFLTPGTRAPNHPLKIKQTNKTCSDVFQNIYFRKVSYRNENEISQRDFVEVSVTFQYYVNMCFLNVSHAMYSMKCFSGRTSSVTEIFMQHKLKQKLQCFKFYCDLSETFKKRIFALWVNYLKNGPEGLLFPNIIQFF
jgi:hypothetical protein